MAASQSSGDTTILIFGASGDLTARKLIPAFYSMHLSNNLPEPFTIVGSSRTSLSDEEFREKLKKATIDDAGMDGAGWDDFAAKLVYQPVTYDQPETFTELADFLKILEFWPSIGVVDSDHRGGGTIPAKIRWDEKGVLTVLHPEHSLHGLKTMPHNNNK